MRLLVLALLAWAAAAQPAFRPLFNGKNLDGWESDTSGVWSVQEGLLVGKSPGLKYNDFLRTRNTYGDFILKGSFRLVNGSGNSGIQFRSKPVMNSHEVSGYQADIGEKYWGCLYDEARRNKVLVQPAADALVGLQTDGWNEYTVTARGDQITLDLNGVRTVDYREEQPGIDRTGIIALQVHAGAPMEVQFRDIRIQELR